jgi:ABC-2 type transport system permease protein
MIRALLSRNLRLHGVLLGSIWAGVFLFEVFLVWVAAQIDMGPGLRVLLEQLVPAEVREAFFAQLGMASFSGALSFGFQHPFVLVGVIAFVIVVATVPTSERESGLADLLLARPVPRRSYVLAVGLLILVGAVLFPLGLLAGATVGLALVEVSREPSWTRYAGATLSMVTLLMAVGGYSLFFGCTARRRGIAAARAAGVTLVFYWLDFLGDYWGSLQSLQWLSPFYYFDPARAAVGSGISARDSLVLLAVWVLFTVLALIAYQRQDL